MARALMGTALPLGRRKCDGCYQIFGLDVILDRKHEAKVIEMNAAAALALGNPMVDGHLYPDVMPDAWRMRGIDHTVWSCNLVALRHLVVKLGLWGQLRGPVRKRTDGEAQDTDLGDSVRDESGSDDLHILAEMLREHFYRGSFQQVLPWSDSAEHDKLANHLLTTLPHSYLYPIYHKLIQQPNLKDLFQPREPFFV